MDEQKLTSLLRQQSPDLAARTPFCPEDPQIAAWFDGETADHEREAVQRHIIDCKFCTVRIGVLSRLKENSGSEDIHGDLLAAAKQMAASAVSRRSVAAPAWAAAAAVVLAVLLTFSWEPASNQIPVSTPGDTSDSGQNRQLRSMDEDALTPRLLSPMEGESVDPVNLTIHWTEIPGSLYYDLYVMTDAGDLLVETRLNGNTWNGQLTDPLLPGKEYFARVEAHFADSRSVSSEHVSFKVADRD